MRATPAHPAHPATEAPAGNHDRPDETRKVLAVVLGLTTFLAIMLSAFAWPSSELSPRDVPIAVAGPQQATAALTEELTASDPEAFAVTTLPDRAAAVQAIKDREVYAAVVAGPQPELLTAPAASPTVAQLLTGAMTSRASGQPPTVTEVVPLPDDDARGAVFGSAALPLVMGGIATGALAALVMMRRRAKVATVAGVAIGAGLVLTALLQSWLGVLEGSYLANAGVVALAIAATASVIVGLHALIGRPGVAIGALSVLLVGNPLSGMTSAPELLPAGWGTLGQLMPPGAAGQALRSTAFFDGAGAGGPLLVLGCWIVAGLGLLALAGLRRQRAEVGSRTDVH